MDLSFRKYEGIGNDFIVCQLPNEDSLPVEVAMQLCDRHYGIGADGVLIVSPARTRDAKAKMSVINADGSRPEMCGNGLRCVALELTPEDQKEAEFVVETDAGPRRCLVERREALAHVTTSMGRGVSLGHIDHDFDGTCWSFLRFSMGNPHAISFAPQLPEAKLDLLGPALSGRIEGGTNVEIATVTAPGRIELSVWERGVGRTLACGTGAAATAVAAVVLGHASAGSPIEIHLPGGPLSLTVSEELNVTLRGPARYVFAGSVRVP